MYNYTHRMGSDQHAKPSFRRFVPPPQGQPDVYRNITETGFFEKKKCITQSYIVKKLNLLKTLHEKDPE